MKSSAIGVLANRGQLREDRRRQKQCVVGRVTAGDELSKNRYQKVLTSKERVTNLGVSRHSCLSKEKSAGKLRFHGLLLALLTGRPLHFIW